MLELLFLLHIALVALLTNLNENRTAFSGQKTDALSFDNCKKLFLPGTLSSILLSIMLSRLFF